jgi:8-oxo-dGTP diphosphatase
VTPKTVLCGIIRRGDEILIAQRLSDSPIAKNLWEFPGGKQEEGETEEECLAREIREELGLEIRVEKYYMETTYHYTHPDKELTIRLVAYTATWVGGEIQTLQCQDAKWIKVPELKDYIFAPADIPMVEKYLVENG